MRPFDTIIMVDWSGGKDTGARPRKDAIWAAAARHGVSEEPVYLRNRLVAEAWIGERIEGELASERRVLLGLDFPFGYPTGFAEAVCGSSRPLDLWAWLAARIEDAPNANNRFDLAGDLNLRLTQGRGPFWGNGLKRDIPGLPRRKNDYRNPFPERRACELDAKGSFTCWQLSGAGAVGSQVLMGLPVVHRLRARFAGDVSVWPFERLDARVAFVEIWPSLTLGSSPEGAIRDAWQVREMAQMISALPPDQLAEMLKVEAPEEGWIFGLGFEDRLRPRPEPREPPEPPPLRDDCFSLPPGVEWIPVEDALAHLRAAMTPRVGSETVPLADAAGRILAADVAARRAHPPRPNSAVDGYGFASGRGPGAHRMPLAEGRAAAGRDGPNVAEGEALRILTGAALPPGVDTVVLQENVRLGAGQIAFRGPLRTGANTRDAGEDVAAGAPILRRGRRLGPADLALAAATGVSRLPVFHALRVGVLSTGDELRDDKRGVFDANRPMLLNLLPRWGHVAVDLGQVGDDRAALRARFDEACHRSDAILTTGGASAGDEDHVSALLQEAGALQMWRIAVKPGRPLALGLWEGTPVFGLPGNPVAAFVCALIFARPALAVLAGAAWPEPEGFTVPAGFAKDKKPGRREYLRARIRDGRAEVFASEGSGRISGLVWAEGLVELPDGPARIQPGDPVRYLPFGQYGI